MKSREATKSLRWNPSVHAVERIREYFGIMEEEAKAFINEAMRGAKYVTTRNDGASVYKYEDKDAMIVVNTEQDVIITVLPPKGKGKNNGGVTGDISTEGNEFLASFQSTVKRELTKARRQFVRESRKLTEEIAVIGLEIAQLNLNKARARSPITQRQIADKVTQILEEQAKLSEQRKQLEAQFRAMKSEVSGFVTVKKSRLNDG